MADTIYDKQCCECKHPIGPLWPGEEVKSGANSGQWRHKPPCPEPARPTGKRAFPFLEKPTVTSTGGVPHKQHKDRNTQVPPNKQK